VNWHQVTVPPDELPTLLARIQSTGGTVTCSKPASDGVHITWTTPRMAPVPAGSAGRH
jgi:hypothetical protein